MNPRQHSTHSIVKLTLSPGIPPHDFFGKAWASEPLTGVLTETNIPFALPGADDDISLVAKNEQDVVVAQCSANRVVKYWNHVEDIDASQQNLSTQIFVKIHKKAIEDEMRHLEKIEQDKEQSFHSAGIAVLPEYRGNNIGLTLRAEQIETCKKKKATTLFCETTNLFSAATVEKSNFDKVAAYPYKDLAVELSHPDLSKLNDSFTVWCRKI